MVSRLSECPRPDRPWTEWPINDHVQFGVLLPGIDRPSWLIASPSEAGSGRRYIEEDLKANPDARLVWRDLDMCPIVVYQNPYHPQPEENDWSICDDEA